jgi:hypothetical protein
VSRHLGPVALLVVAALADAAGRSDLSFYALVVAVAVISVAALAAYGDLVAGGGSHVQTGLWVLGLVLVTASAAVRAPALGAVVPALGGATLTACLALVGIQGALAVARELKAK